MEKRKNIVKFILFIFMVFLLLKSAETNFEVQSYKETTAEQGEVEIEAGQTIKQEPKEVVKSVDVENKIINEVITYKQFPRYPTGCESVSLYILLKYYNVQVTMDQIVNNITKGDLPYDRNGQRYGGNPEIEFIGNPRSKYSFGVYNKPIADIAEKYKKGVISKRGIDFNEVLDLVANDRPVMVWTTIDMKEPYISTEWIYPETGETIRWIAQEHAVVVCGYTNTEVIVSDPYTGTIKNFKKEIFIDRYNKLGQRVIYY